MTTQKTQARERLGALVKRARRKADMPRQDHLAAATGLSVSVISLVERGAKVEDKTLLIIEETLGFRPGSFVDFVEGRIATLPDPARPLAGSAGDSRHRSVVDMTRSELFDAAALVAEVQDEEAGERWLRAALEKRAKHQRAKQDTDQAFESRRQ